MYNVKIIEDQIKEVLSYSQDIPYNFINIEKLIKDWINSKSWFIDKFNNNLILELGKKTFELSDEAKKIKIDEFCTKIEETWNNVKLSNFIFKQREGFYDNITVNDYIIPGSNNIIKQGSKIIKDFKYFVDDKEILHNIQNEASMIIQSNKVSGELCFSIHPLDFLSSSENTYNWRSCHSLDGDFRAGNLEYMVDETTFICYLRGEDNVKLPNFPDTVCWNSKKWRELFFIKKDGSIIWAGRQYPFISEEALDIIRKEISIIFYDSATELEKWSNSYITTFDRNTKNKFNFNNIVFLDDSYLCVGSQLVSKHKIIKPNKNHHHFNDLLTSTCYIPYYTYSLKALRKIKNIPIEDKVKIEIGKNVKCICCGINDIEQDGSMICEKCIEENEFVDDEHCYCECCGKYIKTKDTILVSKGNGEYSYICESCALEKCIVCNNCYKIMFAEDAYYNEEKQMYYCKECLEDMKK